MRLLLFGFSVIYIFVSAHLVQGHESDIWRLEDHLDEPFYPEGHFDYVTKISSKSELKELIETNIEKDKTVFVRWILKQDHPEARRQKKAWDFATKVFAGGEKDYGVVFGDVDLETANEDTSYRHAPGGGGWPSIRFFTRETEFKGGRYKQRTQYPLCQELGDRHWMLDYIERRARVQLCSRLGDNCNERELGFLNKTKHKSTEEQSQELSRLDEVLREKMKPELEEWVFRRIRILEKVIGGWSASRIGDPRYRKPTLYDKKTVKLIESRNPRRRANQNQEEL